MTYTKTIKPALLATAAIGFSFLGAQSVSAQPLGEDAMTPTMSETTAVNTTFENVDPSLIKQNIGDLDSGVTVAGAIEDANTMANFEMALEKTSEDDTLMADGPYTVFVPRDSAFWQVEGQQYVEWMNSPEASNLDEVVKTHIVQGELMSGDLVEQLQNSPDGKVKLTTLSGDTLTAWQADGYVQIADETGNIGQVTTADLDQANGVIHVINTVLEPAI